MQPVQFRSNSRPFPQSAEAMEWMGALQWPAMVASVTAAWLVASQRKNRRQLGFWWFLGSNVLWIAWGLHDHAWALIVLQIALALLNLRGLRKNDPEDSPGKG